MPSCNRRTFLITSAAWMGCTASAHAFWPFKSRTEALSTDRTIRGKIFKGDAPRQLWQWACEGYRYRKVGAERVVCGVCPNRCLLSPGDRSVCRSKVNIDGKLYSLAYGNPCAVHIDPVEKKPLYHFLPASRVFSLAAAGCNFRCLNCQNWEISQSKPEQVHHNTLFPDQAVDQARQSGSQAIAYTYSEPITFFEYMMAIARKAQGVGLKNLWISNGYINAQPLKDLCQVLDGANVNLKAFNDDIYRKLNGGRLDPVLNSFLTMHAHSVHFEITHLVVPGYTDDDRMVQRMCAWILDHLGADYPLHLLRFFPRYKLNRLAPTPVSTLSRFRDVAMAQGLRYVYIGNVPGHPGNHTYCHGCGRMIIERQGYNLPQYHMNGSQCRFCGTRIPGVWPDGNNA